jgi:hypothetical protein
MRTVTIITTKIQPDIYDMVLRGQKRFEVRNESFHDADYIRYISSTTGRELGIYQLGPEKLFDGQDPADRDFCQSCAAISPKTFNKLFPRLAFHDTDLHVAPIGDPRAFSDIFPAQMPALAEPAANKPALADGEHAR